MTARETILQMKYARIIRLVAEKCSISIEKAMDVFYNSKTFEHMADESTGLFTMSDKYLAEDICTELSELSGHAGQ